MSNDEARSKQGPNESASPLQTSTNFPAELKRRSSDKTDENFAEPFALHFSERLNTTLLRVGAALGHSKNREVLVAPLKSSSTLPGIAQTAVVISAAWISLRSFFSNLRSNLKMDEMEVTAILQQKKKTESKIMADSRKAGRKSRQNGSTAFRPAKSKTSTGQASTNRVRNILIWLRWIFVAITAFMLAVLFGSKLLPYIPLNISGAAREKVGTQMVERSVSELRVEENAGQIAPQELFGMNTEAAAPFTQSFTCNAPPSRISHLGSLLASPLFEHTFFPPSHLHRDDQHETRSRTSSAQHRSRHLHTSSSPNMKSNVNAMSPRSSPADEAPSVLADYEATWKRYQNIIESKVQSWRDEMVANKSAEAYPARANWEVRGAWIDNRTRIAFERVLGSKLGGFVWECCEIIDESMIFMTAIFFSLVIYYVAFLNGIMPWKAKAVVKSHLRGYEALGHKVFDSCGKLIKPPILQVRSRDSIDEFLPHVQLLIAGIMVKRVMLLLVLRLLLWAWGIAPDVEPVNLSCVSDAVTGLGICTEV
ncbi:hypothetical protein BST61_g10372 [Cercospora zeina]